MSRRHLLSMVIMLAMLILACAPAAPAPTPAPAKPAAPAAAPTQAPAAQPTAAPATQPTAVPAAKVPAPPAVKPAKLDKVKVGVISWHAWFWVPMVAEEKKSMEPYGIDLELVLTRSAPGQAQGLAAGAIDFGATAPTAVWSVAEKAPEFKMIGTSVAGNGFTMLAQPEIKNLKDLKGKTIGAQSVTVGQDIETMRLLLAEAGLQAQRDYDVVVSGGNPERVAALVAKQVAAIAMTPPETYELLDRGMVALAKGWEHPQLQNIIIGTIVGNQKWYTQPQNRDIAIRFVQGYVATTAWLYDPKNRAEAIQILAKRSGQKPEYAEKTYEQVVVLMKAYGLDPRVDQGKLEQTFANAKLGGQSVPANPMSLVDHSLIEAALK